MKKLQKKERTFEAEFCGTPGEHTKEYCFYAGVKTWMKKRHFKAASQETNYPEFDMDGSPFYALEGPYNYRTEGRKRRRSEYIALGCMDPDYWAGEELSQKELTNRYFGLA